MVDPQNELGYAGICGASGILLGLTVELSKSDGMGHGICG